MRTRPLLALALALVIVIVLGCVENARSEPSFTARDSSGVRIVEYADTPTASGGLVVSDKPLYRVGDEPGEREFSFVVFGALLPDGGAVVSDGQRGSEVVRLSADGSLLVLARAGQGPTEVQAVNGIRLLGGDTVLVQDFSNTKIMLFAGDTLVRSVSLSKLGISAFMLGPAGYRAPDTLLMATQGYRPLHQDSWIQGHLVRLDLETQELDTLGSFDLANPPAQQGPLNPFNATGGAVGSGDFFVIGRSDIPQVTWRGDDGTVRQILRWKPRLRTPTQADLDLYLERRAASLTRVEGMPKAQLDQLIQRNRERAQLDPSQPLPLFGTIRGDGAGGVWLSDYEIGSSLDGTAHWSVIAPDGQWLGGVTLPDRFRVLDIRGNRVLGVLSNSLDVQSVAVFEVKEAPSDR